MYFWTWSPFTFQSFIALLLIGKYFNNTKEQENKLNKMNIHKLWIIYMYFYYSTKYHCLINIQSSYILMINTFLYSAKGQSYKNHPGIWHSRSLESCFKNHKQLLNILGTQDSTLIPTHCISCSRIEFTLDTSSNREQIRWIYWV